MPLRPLLVVVHALGTGLHAPSVLFLCRFFKSAAIATATATASSALRCLGLFLLYKLRTSGVTASCGRFITIAPLEAYRRPLGTLLPDVPSRGTAL